MTGAVRRDSEADHTPPAAHSRGRVPVTGRRWIAPGRPPRARPWRRRPRTTAAPRGPRVLARGRVPGGWHPDHEPPHGGARTPRGPARWLLRPARCAGPARRAPGWNAALVVMLIAAPLVLVVVGDDRHQAARGVVRGNGVATKEPSRARTARYGRALQRCVSAGQRHIGAPASAPEHAGGTCAACARFVHCIRSLRSPARGRGRLLPSGGWAHVCSSPRRGSWPSSASSPTAIAQRLEPTGEVRRMSRKRNARTWRS